MKERDRIDRLVTTWLDLEAPTGAPPELLDDIVSTTGRMRPRPSWLARIEGHHMDVIEGGRRHGVPRLTLILALLALAIALVGVAVAAGAFRTERPSIAVIDVSASPAASTDATTPRPSATPFTRPTIDGDPIPDEVIGSWRERAGDLYMHIFRAGDPVCTVYVQTAQDCSVLQWAADDFYLSDIQILTIQDGKLHQVEFLGRNCKPNVTEYAFEVDATALRLEPTPPTACNSAVMDMVRAGVGDVPLAKPPTNADGPAPNGS